MQTQGSLRDGGLATLLQSMQAERATGTLTIDNGGDNCSLYFLFGHLFHASGPGGQGEEVVIDALGWDDGSYQFDPRAKLPAEETIKASPAELIAAAESRHAPAAAAATGASSWPDTSSSYARIGRVHGAGREPSCPGRGARLRGGVFVDSQRPAAEAPHPQPSRSLNRADSGVLEPEPRRHRSLSRYAPAPVLEPCPSRSRSRPRPRRRSAPAAPGACRVPRPPGRSSAGAAAGAAGARVPTAVGPGPLRGAEERVRRLPAAAAHPSVRPPHRAT